VDPKLRKYFDGVFSNFEQWGREILSYWDYRATNAYTEAANGRKGRCWENLFSRAGW
jgi:transposase